MMGQSLLFGEFRLDIADERLWHGDQVVPIEHRAFRVLRRLVSEPDQLVTKDALLAHAWPNTVVTDAVLTTAVRKLRRALGDEARSPRYIETVHGRGYRFVARVTADDEPTLDRTRPAESPVSTELVGREAEWKRLSEWYAAAADGERRIGFIAGEAGIGKTMLVQSFVANLAKEMKATIVAHGQCVQHYGTGEAYLPVLEALGRLGRGAERERLARVLREHAPSWLAHLPGIVEPQELVDAPHQPTSTRMLRELADALELLTAEQPLVLVLEDLHWSDSATLEWLAYMARRPDRACLLILCTYRPVDAIVHRHPLRALVGELRGQSRCDEVLLGDLSETDVEAFVRSRCGALDRLDVLTRVLFARTDGHPFFLKLLFEELNRRKMLTRSGADWQVDDNLEAVTGLVPTGVRQYIDQQIDRLPAEEQALLEVASVVGRRFSVAACAAGADLSEAEIDSCLSQWAGRAWFVRGAGTTNWPDGTLASAYSFQHDLYQEVLYARIPAGRLVQLHRQIGLRLEAAYGDESADMAGELAVHFEAAHVLAKAVAYRTRAADNAIARSAYSEAIEHARKGLELLGRTPASKERDRRELALYHRLGTMYMAARGWAAQETNAAHLRARELSEQLGEQRHLLSALWGLAASSIVRGQYPETRRYAHDMWKLARRLDDPLYVIVAHFELGATAFGRGRFALSNRHFSAVESLYDESNHAEQVARLGIDLGADARLWRCSVMWIMGYPEQARSRSSETLDATRKLGHPFTLAFALAYSSILYHHARDPVRARETADEGIKLCVEHGFPYYLAWVRIVRVWTEAVEGRCDKEGIETIRRSIETLRAAEVRRFLPYLYSVLAECCAYASCVEEGLKELDRAVACMQATGERSWESELYRLRGELLSLRAGGATAESEACFRKALDVARSQDAKSLELRAAVCLARAWQRDGRRTEARQIVSPIFNWFEHGVDTPDLTDARVIMSEPA